MNRSDSIYPSFMRVLCRIIGGIWIVVGLGAIPFAIFSNDMKFDLAIGITFGLVGGFLLVTKADNIVQYFVNQK